MTPASELYIQNRQLNMTPEEYIEKLVETQYTLDSVKEDLDRAIRRMQKRLETGDAAYDMKSRLSSLAALEYVKLAYDQLLKVGTADIEYEDCGNSYIKIESKNGKSNQSRDEAAGSNHAG